MKIIAIYYLILMISSFCLGSYFICYDLTRLRRVGLMLITWAYLTLILFFIGLLTDEVITTSVERYMMHVAKVAKQPRWIKDPTIALQILLNLGFLFLMMSQRRQGLAMILSGLVSLVNAYVFDLAVKYVGFRGLLLLPSFFWNISLLFSILPFRKGRIEDDTCGSEIRV